MHRVVINDDTLLGSLSEDQFFSGIYRESTYLAELNDTVHRYIDTVPCEVAF
jgi:hypothetical protein